MNEKVYGRDIRVTTEITHARVMLVVESESPAGKTFVIGGKDGQRQISKKGHSNFSKVRARSAQKQAAFYRRARSANKDLS